MKRCTFLYTVLVILLGISCNKSPLSLKDQSLKNSQFNQENMESLLPSKVAMAYYHNLSQMILWYKKHPYLVKSINRDHHQFLNKIDYCKVEMNGKSISMFEMSYDELEHFLGSWVKMNAFQLDKKIAMCPPLVDRIISRNNIFTNIFEKDSRVDQFPIISNKISESEGELTKKIITTSDKSNKSYWLNVLSNSILTSTNSTKNHPSLPLKTFVNNIRSSIIPGRLIFALPGGYSTKYPVVFYRNKQWFNVGHAAIFTKWGNSIPVYPDTSFSFTMSTDIGSTFRHENPYKWANKHANAFVGQIVDKTWTHTYDTDPITGQQNPNGQWHVSYNHINNYAFYNYCKNYLNAPYCKWYQLLSAKSQAPNRFICSTIPWFVARKEYSIDISDWWKTTIFPTGLFYSDNILILDATI